MSDPEFRGMIQIHRAKRQILTMLYSCKFKCGICSGSVRALCFLLLVSCSGGVVSAGEPLVPVFLGQPGRIAYLDSRGSIALKTDYTEAEFFQDGLARVCHSKCGYIDVRGSQKFGFDMIWIGYRSEGRIPFCVESGCGFLDANGKVSIAARFEDVKHFSEGLAGAKKDGLWGFVDGKGVWKIAPRYGSVQEFSENRAAVQDARAPHLYGLINRQGNVVLKFKHQRIFSYSDGRARFFHWDRYGYLNLQGIMELPATLEWAQDPVSGLSYFVHESRQGYRVGDRVMLSLNCPGGSDFASQKPIVARVRDCKTGNFQYIDGSGEVWKAGYAKASDFVYGFALARKPGDEHFVLIDASGKEFSLESGIRPAW